MDDKYLSSDEAMTPLDDVLTDLTVAVRSLNDTELRELLVALLSEWRDRRGAAISLPN
ncbi:hypothetical protein DBT53_000700 [Aerococcus mictus]|jgi:hypothetical protein|uniref:hypothetical protein n=1 Tax=Bacteria TaxID=2 RepID=UPI0015EC4BA3|nr:hypothetical protein [Parvibaculum sp.]MDR3498770.1 hypothetical protein [Parvibaculum sp.]